MSASPKPKGRVAAWALIIVPGGTSLSLSIAHALHLGGETDRWMAVMVGTIPAMLVAVLAHLVSHGKTDKVDWNITWGVLLLSFAMSASAQAASVDRFMDWILHWSFPFAVDLSTIVGLRRLMAMGKEDDGHEGEAEVATRSVVAMATTERVATPYPAVAIPVATPVMAIRGHDRVATTPEPVAKIDGHGHERGHAATPTVAMATNGGHDRVAKEPVAKLVVAMATPEPVDSVVNPVDTVATSATKKSVAKAPDLGVVTKPAKGKDHMPAARLAVMDNPEITYKELAMAIGCAPRTATRCLAKIKAEKDEMAMAMAMDELATSVATATDTE